MAVIQFQKDNNLIADGMIGEKSKQYYLIQDMMKQNNLYLIRVQMTKMQF